MTVVLAWLLGTLCGFIVAGAAIAGSGGVWVAMAAWLVAATVLPLIIT